jgi:hypothetical protein
VTLDHGSKFIYQDFCDMCENDYRIKRKVISMCNLQVNTIIECMHQTLGSLLVASNFRTKPTMTQITPGWALLLAAVVLTLCSTYHTTLRSQHSYL